MYNPNTPVPAALAHHLATLEVQRCWAELARDRARRAELDEQAKNPSGGAATPATPEAGTAGAEASGPDERVALDARIEAGERRLVLARFIEGVCAGVAHSPGGPGPLEMLAFLVGNAGARAELSKLLQEIAEAASDPESVSGDGTDPGDVPLWRQITVGPGDSPRAHDQDDPQGEVVP